MLEGSNDYDVEGQELIIILIENVLNGSLNLESDDLSHTLRKVTFLELINSLMWHLTDSTLVKSQLSLLRSKK